MYILTHPTLEPVSVEDAKASARVDGMEWDDIVAGYISAAREYCEHLTGRLLMEQTQRIELADWPAADEVFNVYRPSTVAVSYWNGSTWVTAVDGTGYAWGIVDRGFGVVPALNSTFPTLGEVAIGPRVRIDVTAGAATVAEVPASAKLFIKALVALMIDNPSLTAQRTVEANQYLVRIIDPLREYA